MHKTPEETTHYRAITCVAKQATRRTICSSTFPQPLALAVGEEGVAWAIKKVDKARKQFERNTENMNQGEMLGCVSFEMHLESKHFLQDRTS
jgi:hypothetical protein